MSYQIEKYCFSSLHSTSRNSSHVASSKIESEFWRSHIFTNPCKHQTFEMQKSGSSFRLAESNISQSQSIKKRKGKRNISKESRLTETRTVNPFVSLLAQNMQIRATLCRTLNFKVCLVKTLALDCQTLHLKSGPEEINKFLSAFPPPTSTHNE